MIAEEINKHISKFRNFLEIREEEKNVKCTYFCSDGGDNIGFVEDCLYDDLGINMFICKLYITQNELINEINKEEDK